jgi:hypothetical protein
MLAKNQFSNVLMILSSEQAKWFFVFINMKQEAVPIVMPLSNWICSANDDIMFAPRTR